MARLTTVDNLSLVKLEYLSYTKLFKVILATKQRE